MSVIKVPTDNVYNMYKDGYYGSLSLLVKPISVDWHNCRETYHSHNPRSARLLFAAHDGNSKRVISFIGHAERILKLSEDQATTFSETDTNGVLEVNMGKFWRVAGRRSLFTILLRAAKHYKNKQFYTAAAKDEYLKQTWEAFKMFMGGRTYIPQKRKFSDSGGWRNFFRRHKSKAALKINLVKPCRLKTNAST